MFEILELQTPIIHRRGKFVTLVKISLGDWEVAFDHIHCGVAEHDLEGVRIAAISQVVDGEGMSEAVDVNALYAGPVANNFQYI